MKLDSLEVKGRRQGDQLRISLRSRYNTPMMSGEVDMMSYTEVFQQKVTLKGSRQS